VYPIRFREAYNNDIMSDLIGTPSVGAGLLMQPDDATLLRVNQLLNFQSAVETRRLHSGDLRLGYVPALLNPTKWIIS
jgi:hypothetical protein